MLDELVGVAVDALTELVPDVVWGVLLGLVGIAAVGVGVFLLGESTAVGAALVGGGALAVGAVVSTWRR